MKWKTYKFIL